MMTVRLDTNETFVIPDKYEVNIETVDSDNKDELDIIKIKCLVVTDDTSIPIKKRCYPLSHIVAFGDSMGLLP